MARGFGPSLHAPAEMEFDVFPRLLRASKLRVGGMRATGVPAILLGVSAVVLAAGVSRSLAVLAPSLPESLRETKGLLEAMRPEARSLTP